MSRLVLTRSPNKTICIGDNIRVSVLSVSGANVRLAIEAPADVSVDREEIRARKLSSVEEVQWGVALAADPQK